MHTLTLAAYAGAIVSRPKGKKAVAPWALLGVLAGVIHTARAVSFGLRCGDHERADVHKHGHWLGAALSFLGPAVIGLVTPRKGDSSWQLVPSFAPDERGAASASLHLLGRW